MNTTHAVAVKILCSFNSQNSFTAQQ